MIMINKIKTASFLLILNLLLASSCGDDAKFSFSGNVITITKTGDLGDKNNASDFWAEIAINEEAIASVVEVRTVFVDASINSGVISEDDILSLPESNYHPISKFNFLDKDKLIIEPGPTVPDSNGKPLLPGKQYKVIIAALGKDNAISLPPAVEFALTSESAFTGKYVGVWSDEKIKSLGISLIIFDDKTGRLYYTKGFKPCCGGTEDATLKMKINMDGTAMLDFEQYLGNYPPGTGGHCTARMSTTGKLDGNILLLNSFPFSDCDGGGRTVQISNLTRQ